jgi:hypothetical protein
MHTNPLFADILVSQGADVNSFSGTFSPLHVAAVFSGEEMIHFLCNSGADTSIHTKFPSTPNANPLLLAQHRKNGEANKGLYGYFKAIEAVQEALAYDRKKIVLSKLGISYLPSSLFNCRSITQLDLSRNRLESLPRALYTLRQLKFIDIRSNPLHLVPQTIRSSQNGLNIVQYLTSIEYPSSTQVWNLLKVMVIGGKNAGKKTLLKSLIGENQVLFLVMKNSY